MQKSTIDQINENLPVLKVGTAPTEVEIISEPFVRNSVRGYMPCVKVIVIKSGLEYALSIGSKSITEGIEKLRKDNNGYFTKLKFNLSKKDDAQMAPYILMDSKNKGQK
jgi:hypothetical protein